MKKVVSVVGARPQFVKAAALSRAFAACEGIEEVMIHTGQHFDANMSDIFFSELGIPAPKHHLGIGGGKHGEMTGKMLAGIEEILLAEKPDCLLIYGDTNSTLAGALAASKLNIAVAHVEAGLRSFNRRMPEEVNRVLSDHVSKWLFCPTQTAVNNLKTEGITHGVHMVGDVMYDAALDAAKRAQAGSDILARLGLAAGSYSLATVHRAENTDDSQRLQAVFDHLKAVSAERTVVLPLHPRTANAVKAHNISLGFLNIIDPVGYLDMTALLVNCFDVHTDSGGVQKEAYFHGKECVTLRDETEWVETIEAGWNRLWTQPVMAVEKRAISDYGTGNCAGKIVSVLLREL
ncbi:non-hydrolyzing UDP-N-acetylglucosamine 2-epimerase [Terasakiella pusilla]|uniref:non-hydrolyzing UDP-N-acetylglucosamine 2-epimerase n=1 Tax=Terasakiella pusilla TaxID=64973 RepID=UPI003AA8CDDE